jgi:flagellar biosynthesis/type III secretory pathway chaperone
MPPYGTSPNLILVLEGVLVKEFRMLQALVEITREEREILPKNDVTNTMRLVEEKEALLDQLVLLEDTRRMRIQELAQALSIQSDNSSLKQLLPHIDPEDAERLERLSDGIISLVRQVRDLNLGNRALAASMVDWLQSARAFLMSFTQVEAGYRPPGVTQPVELNGLWNLDHRV